VLGAFILVPTQQWLAYRYGASELYLIAYATVFLLIVLLLPRGIIPSIRDVASRQRDRLPGATLPVVPPPEGVAP
jgi:branched-chain amino acid transport system permease protein